MSGVQDKDSIGDSHWFGLNPRTEQSMSIWVDGYDSQLLDTS